MKKEYIVPKAKAITLKFEGMIAGSFGSDLEETGNGGNTGDNGITEGDSNRRNSIWDNTEW